MDKTVCGWTTTYSVVWENVLNRWFTVPSSIFVCHYVLVESNDGTNLTATRSETKGERNERVLNEMSECLVSRVEGVLDDCEGSRDSFSEDGGCEVDADDLEVIEDFEHYLTTGYPPIVAADLNGLYGINRGRVIEVDVSAHSTGNESGNDAELANTIVHERLHSYPSWCRRIDSPANRHEHTQIYRATDTIIDTLEDYFGSFSVCVNWEFKDVEE